MSSQKKNNPIALLILVGGGLLLIVAALLFANQIPAATPTPAVAFEEETYPEIQRVSINEAKAALDSGSALIVDVRSAEAFQGSHISGAINIPLGELEARLGELDKAQWIITYCT
ncbi:MAG: rhodanese-like domain-containing protein [Chloroflexi bacterium]|nr:rhodanese-like domain-containing protein [Chloroflexota bacterium]